MFNFFAKIIQKDGHKKNHYFHWWRSLPSCICNFQFDNGFSNGTISILKWVKTLVISIPHTFLWILFKSGGTLPSEKGQNCSSHFGKSGVRNWAISISKRGKILVIVMGFTNASVHWLWLCICIKTNHPLWYESPIFVWKIMWEICFLYICPNPV